MVRMEIRQGIGWLMAAIAVSLGVMSFLHLSGTMSAGTADGAGIPEAVIGGVLLAAALYVFAAPDRARPAAVGATGFAIAGFVIGISFTISGGQAVDIAYHAVVLPILVGLLVTLLRLGPRVTASSQPR
jgi:hypothetical protein